MQKSLNNILSIIEDWFVAIAIFSSSMILFVNVVLRYFFDAGVIWAEEATRYIIIWLVFIGGSVAARHGAHLSVTALVDSINPKVAKKINIFACVLSILFAGFLAIYGTQLAINIKATGQVTPALLIPAWLVYLAIPIGGTLMVYRFTQSLVKIIKNDSQYVKPDGKELA